VVPVVLYSSFQSVMTTRAWVSDQKMLMLPFVADPCCEHPVMERLWVGFADDRLPVSPIVRQR